LSARMGQRSALASLTRRVARLWRNKGRMGRRECNTAMFGKDAVPGPLVVEVFEKIRRFPGWFNIDDCSHFSIILAMQNALGLGGDLLEIGCYHGRSTCLMARYLKPGERVVVCDAFEEPTEDDYGERPTPERLWANLLTVNPQLDRKSVVIHEQFSTLLALRGEEQFRFIHIDGGHSRDVALHDMRLCARHLLGHGVMVVDDYQHRGFPGVTEAVDAFLAENRHYTVIADLNRFGAIGRKIYLCRMPGPATGD